MTKFISKEIRNKLTKEENDTLTILIENHRIYERCSCSSGEMCPIALYEDGCSFKDLKYHIDLYMESNKN